MVRDRAEHDRVARQWARRFANAPPPPQCVSTLHLKQLSETRISVECHSVGGSLELLPSWTAGILMERLGLMLEKPVSAELAFVLPSGGVFAGGFVTDHMCGHEPRPPQHKRSRAS